jgi:hypothetical protein
MKVKDSILISAPVQRNFHDQVAKVAADQDRSIASLIRLALSDYLTRHGGAR